MLLLDAYWNILCYLLVINMFPFPSKHNYLCGVNAALLEKPWHYIDPQGAVQGPFAMSQLQQWQNAGYFAKDFKIWRTDETKDRAILLVQAAQMIDSLIFV